MASGATNSDSSSRPLIAFAFLAQAGSGGSDLLGRLAPLFKLVAKSKVGKKFDAAEFAREVGRLYFIDVHPWAAEDLAPRLERAGLLTRNQLSTGAHEYFYAPIETEFNEVSEADIRLVVQKFVAFAAPILASHSLPVDAKALEVAFFAQLIQMDFVSILTKPERTPNEGATAGTIKLKKSQEEVEKRQEFDLKARIDVLCASFILQVYRTERAIYDLLVKIASGALMAETVLNFQSPGGAVSLEKLNVVLDAPFLMAFLNLELEETHTYAHKICDTLRKHGATLGTFRHSSDELRDNLNGVINLTAEGKGFGATARRLNNVTFAEYANAVRANPESAIAGAGIRLVALPSSTTAYQYFSQEDEENLHSRLGRYANPLAQRRDAASIGGVVRLRFGKRVRMTNFQQTDYLFVTENPFLAERAQRFLMESRLLSADEVPAAVTDRYLAGLLLVLFGGVAAEFTQYKLLANCASALEVRNDVIARMHRFLGQVGQEEADRFRALMTVERAGQHLMQLTLGESIFVTDSNAHRILEDLEGVLVERERSAFEVQLKEIRAKHEQEILDSGKQTEVLRGQALDAEASALLERQQRKSTEQRARELEEKLKQLGDSEIRQRQDRVAVAVKFALKCERWAHHILAVLIGLVAFVLTYFGMNPAHAALSPYISAGVGAIALVSFWNTPRTLFGGYLAWIRGKAFSFRIALGGTQTDVAKCDIDWTSGEVRARQ